MGPAVDHHRLRAAAGAEVVEFHVRAAGEGAVGDAPGPGALPAAAAELVLQGGAAGVVPVVVAVPGEAVDGGQAHLSTSGEEEREGAAWGVDHRRLRPARESLQSRRGRESIPSREIAMGSARERLAFAAVVVAALSGCAPVTSSAFLAKKPEPQFPFKAMRPPPREPFKLAVPAPPPSACIGGRLMSCRRLGLFQWECSPALTSKSCAIIEGRPAPGALLLSR